MSIGGHIERRAVFSNAEFIGQRDARSGNLLLGGRPVAASSCQSSFSKQESTSIDTCGTPMISITAPRVR